MTWKPMLDMPDELRDGRPVLFQTRSGAVVSCEYSKSRCQWFICLTDIWLRESSLTHYCEITPPTEDGK